MPRAIVAINAPRRNADFLVYARHIADSLARSPHFPPKWPLVARLVRGIARLEAAEVKARLGPRGSAAARNGARASVYSCLQLVRGHVEQAACRNPEAALAIIASSGMALKASSGSAKPAFKVLLGSVSGTVHLFVRAPRTRASFDWQYRQREGDWIGLAGTVRADVVIGGLVAGRYYDFRYRVTTRDGVGDWSDPITVLVT